MNMYSLFDDLTPVDQVTVTGVIETNIDADEEDMQIEMTIVEIEGGYEELINDVFWLDREQFQVNDDHQYKAKLEMTEYEEVSMHQIECLALEELN